MRNATEAGSASCVSGPLWLGEISGALTVRVTMLASPIQSQNAVLLKNVFFCPRMYSCGYRSKILADTNWSNTPITRGGRTVKATLYNDNVQDSYAICPEKLFRNKNCGVGVINAERGTTQRTQNWVMYNMIFL
jgi:hypothetical protein